jgi:hypothetical protein
MPETPSPVALCTIVAANYLAHARALTQSFRACHPQGQVFVLLVDRLPETIDPAQEPFQLVEVRQIGIPAFDAMAFRYTILELSTAVKPFFLEYLFERFHLERLVYLDPDIIVYAPLTPALEALDAADVALTPHLLAPLAEDGCRPTELDILRAGVYNLGFIALRQGPHLLPLLHWWQRKLEKECLNAVEQGLFVDQRWADLIPAFVPRVAILRHPGLNAAYWNLAQRRVTATPGGWQVDGQPLVFYHFSGIDLANLEALSRFQDRFTFSNRPELRPLFEDYHRRLLSCGYAQVHDLPYAFDTFDNGVPIPAIARRLWASLPPSPLAAHPLVAHGTDSFFNTLNAPAVPDAGGLLRLTHLALAIYNLRADVQAAYPQVTGPDRLAYLNWFCSDGAHQHGLDPAFIQPVAASLPPPARRMAQVILAGKPLTPAVETPSSHPTSWKRRLYYAVRNPLRRLGLARLARRIVGEERAHRIFTRMVKKERI